MLNKYDYMQKCFVPLMINSMDDPEIGNSAREAMDQENNDDDYESAVDSEGEKQQCLSKKWSDIHPCSDSVVNEQVIASEHDYQDGRNNAGNIGRDEDFKEGDNTKEDDLETTGERDVTSVAKGGEEFEGEENKFEVRNECNDLGKELKDDDFKQENSESEEELETRDYFDCSDELKRENATEPTNQWNNVGWGEEFMDEHNVKKDKWSEIPTNEWNDGNEQDKNENNWNEDLHNVEVSETREHDYFDSSDRVGRGNGALWSNRGAFVKLPVRMGAEDCAFYMKTGSCKFGSGCKFNHPPRGMQIAKDFSGSKQGCKFHLRPEGCRFGDSCKFLHSSEKSPASQYKPPEFNAFGLPIRHGEKHCAYYMRNGSCKFGSTCRFHHPDFSIDLKAETPSKPPTNTASYEPVSITTKNGFQNQYGDSNRVESGSEFPERPEQPECSHFVKTGYCKFKSNCKFHHPRNLSSCALSEKGLPLRPDQNVCAFYGRYGICKFGPSCRFNHPIQPYSV